ncbi:hypothetical protein OGATHE_001802 [Ogataea polymorpha]|uniref:Uncharacterized protein n=1 Tax=Ogataea polymorpha TaxID=460523 RepID=A0A9P8PL36_9ASCO|nr:hypothetical protein OGATHE_001802 [Ogataea polymorpha]
MDDLIPRHVQRAFSHPQKQSSPLILPFILAFVTRTFTAGPNTSIDIRCNWSRSEFRGRKSTILSETCRQLLRRSSSGNGSSARKSKVSWSRILGIIIGEGVLPITIEQLQAFSGLVELVLVEIDMHIVSRTCKIYLVVVDTNTLLIYSDELDGVTAAATKQIEHSLGVWIAMSNKLCCVYGKILRSNAEPQFSGQFDAVVKLAE